MLSWIAADHCGHRKQMRDEQIGRVRKVSQHTLTWTEHTAKSKDRGSLFPRGASPGEGKNILTAVKNCIDSFKIYPR